MCFTAIFLHKDSVPHALVLSWVNFIFVPKTLLICTVLVLICNVKWLIISVEGH